MHQHRVRTRKRHGLDKLKGEKKKPRLFLVGHPNVGKSVIFSHLTGAYMTVSNYPGTTVELASGLSSFKPHWEVVDTPGINSFLPHSADEAVTLNLLLDRQPEDTVLVVADAKNLRRSLLLATNLLEMGYPFIIDLNMLDEAEMRGIEIDTETLSQLLGVEVVKTVATEGKGIDKLIKAVNRAREPHFRFHYEKRIEEAVEQISSYLPQASVEKRFMALMTLAGNEVVKKKVKQLVSAEDWRKIQGIVDNTQLQTDEPLALRIEKKRADVVAQLVKRVFKQKKLAHASSFFEKIGAATMHPLLGLPFLAFILFVIYEVVGVFAAGTLVDFLENQIFGSYINPFLIYLIAPLPYLLRDFLMGPYGLISMGLTYALAIVLPIVTAFFFIFSLLEDTGYLPRLAALLNRAFKAVGLSGKAVLPLVLGLGCATMATLTSRILETKKERIIVTLLLALAIPCSAQLGVIMGLLASVSLQVFLIYVLVIVLQLLLVGFLAARLIPGERADFLIEIPPFRVPKFSNLLIKTLYRVEWFLKEAVPLFLIGTAILFLADRSGLLSYLERVVSPVVKGFVGLPPQTTEAFIMGFLRRDYGAAGLFKLAKAGLLQTNQILVSMVVITLFVPCIANFLVIIKERGWKIALAIIGFIFPFAFLVGGMLNFILNLFGVKL
jgi:ferrous iron transport protein B